MGSGLYALYTAKSAIVNRMRRGDRTVLWTMDHGLGFGNHLYLWLHAHIEQAAGRDYKVLVTDAQRPWLDRIPSLKPLTIERANARFHDRREWGHTPRLYQRFGEDYDRESLQDFIRGRILPSITVGQLSTDCVVLNIRRGDYYTKYRAEYGMNVPGYVSVALALVDAEAPLHIVSDDPSWCRTHLDGLHRGDLTFAAHDPWENFVSVSTARTLVGTNSTFSYWGGYIGDVIHGQGRAVIMPWFHKRAINGGAADQLDPRWKIVDHPPGGWDEVQ